MSNSSHPMPTKAACTGGLGKSPTTTKLPSAQFLSVVVASGTIELDAPTSASDVRGYDRTQARNVKPSQMKASNAPASHDAHKFPQPNIRAPVARHYAPGYVREQIPRLSCFISLLIYHVWTSKTLCQTLDVGNRNQYMITFVKNVLEITRIPLPVVTLAVKYIQRLRRLRAASACIPGDETRIFSVALMLAQKYSDDMPYGNRMWGKVLGLSAIELTRLEINFLSALGYNLYVPEVEYSTFCRGVQALAREWNASLASLEERQSKSPATEKQTVNASLRINTTNTTSYMPHNVKHASLTPTSPVPHKKAEPEIQLFSKSEFGHVALGVSPSSIVDSCSTPNSSRDENDVISNSNHTSADFCVKFPSPSCAIATSSTFRSAASLPPMTYLQSVTTPAPPTLDDFIIAAPKTYGLVANSIASVTPSPSLLQPRPPHQVILSPMPGFTNMVLATSVHAQSPSYLLVTASEPRYLFLNAGEFSKASSHAVSRSHSRAGSETPGDERKVVKRAKLK